MTFGGSNQATNVAVVDAQTITVTTPPHKIHPQTVTVVVKNPDNQTDVKSAINERQAIEVGTNEKNATALDLS